jgi:ribose transport system permease protein
MAACCTFPCRSLLLLYSPSSSGGCCAGRASYATGDDLIVARIAGIPVRNLIVAQYILSGLIAYAAGLVMAASVARRIYNSTMIYDVLLVVTLIADSLINP